MAWSRKYSLRSYPRSALAARAVSYQGQREDKPAREVVRSQSRSPVTRVETHKVVCGPRLFSVLVQTFATLSGLSEMGHVWTAPGWQEEPSLCSVGRSSHVFGLFAR